MYFLRDPKEVTVSSQRIYVHTIPKVSSSGKSCYDLQQLLRSTAVGSECHSLVLLVITLEAAFRDTIGNTYLQQAGWAVLAEFVCSLRVTGELTVRAAPPAAGCKGYGSLLGYATYTQ